MADEAGTYYPATHAARTPGKPAIIMGGSGEIVTYRQLDDRSNQCAQLLRQRGVTRGGSVAVFIDNQPGFFDVCWGAQRSGLYYTTLNTHLTASEAAYIIDDCDAEVLITSSALSDVARELADRMPRVHTRLMLGGKIDGYESYEEAIAEQPAHPIPDQSEGCDMLYSSGTTGRPKGIRNPLPDRPIGTPSPLIAALANGMYGVSGESVYLSPAPLYHSAPLRFTMTLLRIGATCIVMERFDPREALELIERHGVTFSQWVPTMFVRMLKLPEEERSRFDLSSHVCALHAAAPCPVPVKQEMIEWWGPILEEYYGATEGHGSTQISSEEWLAHPGSVGRPLGCEIHIVDDDGNELPTNEIGNIYFSGGAPFEYHKDLEKTKGTRMRDGWASVGDMGYVDEDGYLYLTDRKANMIISGGVNIYPQETEDVLVMHPKVADVAVFGVPNEDFGEEVKAVVQPMEPSLAGPDLEKELIEYCRQSLSAIKCPRSIDFDPALPRLDTGKLYKRQIRERYWQGHETRIL
ncbi:MAG: AMP-binding protein [Deltaproteobacteria bacterium]|nr:AMP-binding protein [Deltaproteobacteria bacterium]MBW2382382.1 AMP-binding protein [Deltaproteobacteria bacterium]